jgi:adenosylcobinamide hydrolase
LTASSSVPPALSEWSHKVGSDLALWQFPAPRLAIASAPLGGGCGLRSWVMNAQVPLDYARTDPDVHLQELAAEAGLRGRGVAMMTAASVRDVVCREEEGVMAAATVGLSKPTLAASWDEDLSPFEVGTINLVVQVPVSLSAGALVNAVVTATEAKTQGLLELGIKATGTASDAICVLCPPEGEEAVFAGPRSPWGSRIARAVYQCMISRA